MGLSRRSVLVVLAIGLVLACEPRTAADCDELSAIVPHPRHVVVPGVQVGPLLVTSGMWSGVGRPQIGWARAEDLPKFLIARTGRFDEALTLTGRHCEDGRPLRFAAQPPWAFGAELSTAEIERRTTASRTIAPPPPPEVIVVGEIVDGGYFIFTAAGRWRIEAHDGDRLVGAAVIEVRKVP